MQKERTVATPTVGEDLLGKGGFRYRQRSGNTEQDDDGDIFLEARRLAGLYDSLQRIDTMERIPGQRSIDAVLHSATTWAIEF